MSNVLPFLLMSKVQAARFREETAGDDDRLEPREIMAGQYQGSFVLPERVIYDEAFAARRDALRMLTIVLLDVDAAFPPIED